MHSLTISTEFIHTEYIAVLSAPSVLWIKVLSTKYCNISIKR